MDKILDHLTKSATEAGLKLLYALIILIAGIKIAKYVIKLLNKSRGYLKLDAGVRTFINSALKIILNALVILTAAYVLGIPMTSFMTILASCGLAVGLAFQGSLSNLAGGLMILIFKPFKVGDFIETGEKKGTVHDVTVFYTVLHTIDNYVLTIPNGTVMAGDIINYWQLDKVRLTVECSTSYSDDMDKTKSVLLDVASSYPEVLDDPPPKVVLDKMNESSLDFILIVWVSGKDYWNVKFRMNESVKKAFDENSISIPFPQLDIHNC